MKKVLLVLFAAIIVVSGLLFTSKTKAESEVQDQYCVAGSGYETLGNNGVSSQTFVPIENRLSYINLKIGGIGLNGGTSITATILESFNGTVIGSKSVLPTMAESGIRQWVFSAPLTLDTSKTYQIKLEKIGSGTVYWYYGEGDQTCDGNNRTYGFRDEIRQSWDFNYGTYGYNQSVDLPINTNGNANSNTNANANVNTNSVVINAGQSAGSGSAPAAATSALIKAASGLTATYADNAVKLIWTKTTTADIDGYKVFRSEEKTKNFKEIGKNTKTTFEYVDTKDLTANKIYYYFVRAYKGTAESASTETAEITIPEAVAVAANTNTNKSVLPVLSNYIDDTDYEEIQLYWILGGVISILLVLLAAYEIEKTRKGAFVGARHFRLFR